MATNTYSKEFESWGYESDEVCWICGKTPARLEPRFGYPACEDHYHLAPVRFNHAPFRPKGR